jgi:hypothetical protein
MMWKISVLLAVTLISFGCKSTGSHHVWWEAEDAVEHNWPDNGTDGQFAPKGRQESAKLSGGAWLNAGPAPAGLSARYEIEVPATGRYRFWVRRFWNFGPFTWSIDGGKATTVRKSFIFDNVEVRPLLTASWISAGQDIRLTAGKHSIRIVTLASTRPSGVAAFDSFCLVQGPWYPSGIHKPDAALPEPPEGHWTFPLRVDSYRDDALLDLRSLNEKVAGQSGRVRLTPDGNNMLLGDASPVRFWALSVNSMDIPDGDLETFARFQAKMGVNMVRLFQFLPGTPTDAEPETISEQYLKDWWRYVAAMKREGIYTFLCPYWSHATPVRDSWRLPGVKPKATPYGILIFDERLQKLYRSWVKQMLTRPNPYTGIPLAKDPSIAVFQIQNEDSLFWWSALRGCSIEVQQPLGKRYADWLIAKHGSLDAAVKTWGGNSARLDGPESTLLQDHFAEGIAGFQPIFAMTGRHQEEHADDPQERRSQDQLAFFAHVQRDFYERTAAFLRKECGYDGLISACNWYTADDGTLIDVERWTYAANDVMCKNKYVPIEHINPARPGWESHSVSSGDYYQDASVLGDMGKLPIALRQVDGHPSMITESAWNQPNGYRGEAPFLIACYGSLIGFDSFQWFHPRGIQWDTGLTKRQVGDPATLGTFPAAALLYRQGYVQEAAPAVREQRTLTDLWTKIPSQVVERKSYDPIYAADRSTVESTDGKQPAQPDIPWPAFLAGPVRVAFGEKTKTTQANLNTLIDWKAGIVRSVTRELLWDWRREVCTVNASRAQGATGFLARRGPIQLDDVRLTCGNDYATVLVVPLDGKPLARSRRILVQCTTAARPLGFASEPARFDADQIRENSVARNQKRQPKKLPDRRIDGRRILSLGTAPWVVKNTLLRVELANRNITRAALLDTHGRARQDIALEKTDTGIGLNMPPDGMWVVLSAR